MENHDPEVYSVSKLNREARALLEGNFPRLTVQGEISNLARPQSGHLYFSLKDSHCQIRCAMFRRQNYRLGITPANGQQVVIRARVSLYEARGEFQLIVEHLEAAGVGALRIAFEALKARLDSEGLFANERKKILPKLPHTIGIITSPTGAALRDILSVLARRDPGIAVIIYPVPVQGVNAGAAIATALTRADARGECDVLLLTRGGGSLEDLWAFNEECVARAIFGCATPVVSGVGHEIDFSIADLVADVRAATPSAAAELISEDRRVWLDALTLTHHRLTRAMDRHLATRADLLARNMRRWRDPGRRIDALSQRLDELNQRLGGSMRDTIILKTAQLERRHAQLHGQSPSARLARAEIHCHNLEQRLIQANGSRIARLTEHLLQLGARIQVPRIDTARTRASHLSQRLEHAMTAIIGARSMRLEHAQKTLAALNPQATLERGYAIVRRQTNNHVIRDADTTVVGEQVTARLARGTLNCVIEHTTKHRET